MIYSVVTSGWVKDLKSHNSEFQSFEHDRWTQNRFTVLTKILEKFQNIVKFFPYEAKNQQSVQKSQPFLFKPTYLVVMKM